MAMLPMAMYGLEVPAGDVAIPARPDIPAAFRITMAAIDPDAEPEGDGSAIPRATLKVIRQPLLDEFDEDEESDEDFDMDEMERMLAGGDSEDDSEDDEEEANGGPSDPAKSKKAKREAAQKEIQKLLEEEGMDIDEDDIPNGINGVKKSAKAKGKMPAGEDDDDDEDEDEDEFDSEDDDEGEIEEFVICTLDPAKNYQQTLDITIGEDERVWFKVSGTHSIHLTGNYVEPADREDMLDSDIDDDEYDLEPDEDEVEDDLDSDEELEELDELDELDDPRITELEDDEHEVPALVKAQTKKTKNKRSAPEHSDDEDGAQTIDDMIAKASKSDGEDKLSKKQQKKLKKNDGAAGTAPGSQKKEIEAAAASKADKKVSFAKNLEQGPTPTKAKASDKDGSAGSLGVKTIQGVKIDDKKLGSGQVAKSGDRVNMRYIGKLAKDGKVFDSNKKGKPFSFKLGSGEVIKGWDIGVAGMSAGGERRITIPPHLAYGSKSLPGIPASSALVFDIKMLDINKGR